MMLALAWGVFGFTGIVAVTFGALYWFGLSRTHLDKESMTAYLGVYSVGAGLILATMLMLPL